MSQCIRENWIDVTKGFAIYLVILGHCIQYATPINYNYDNNEIFVLIYSFHMPLFMCVSGYLFFYTLRRYDFMHALLAKLNGIMVPCAIWGACTYIIDIICNKNYADISLLGYIDYTLYSNWFLWAVFYCSLAGFVIKYVFKDKIIGYIVVIAVNSVLPVFLNYDGAKRMMPFFLIGILVNKFKLISKVEGKKGVCILSLFIIMYIISMKITPNVELITGTLGSGAICIIFYYLCKRYRLSILSKLGQISIGIYLLSGIIFWFWVKEYGKIDDSYRYLIKAGYVVGLSFILTIVCYCICSILKKFTITNRLFLGK